MGSEDESAISYSAFRTSLPGQTGKAQTEQIFSTCTLASIKDESLSVEARCLYQKGKWIERKIVRETVSEQAEPTILRDIGELLTLLWALVFETKHILKMMNHLMNENR